VAKNTYKPSSVNHDEKVSAERWQYPDVGQNSESRRGGIGILTAEKIEMIQQQAFQQAYEEGYAKGFEKGKQEGQQSLAELKKLLDNTISFLQQPLREVDREVERQLFELVVSMTRQLVRREIKTDPGEIVAVIRDAIRLLPVASNRITVALHPQDNALLKELFKSINDVEQWRLVDDIGLQRGDCKVSAGVSSIDASLETRLMSIVNKVWGDDRESDAEFILDDGVKQ